MQLTLIYTTTDTTENAHKIISHLLSKKLIACANFHPINSVYNWKSELKNEKELAIILKTSIKNTNKAKQELSKIHNYNTPCILDFSANSNENYYNWLTNSL